MDKELKIRISVDNKTGAVKVISSEFDSLNNTVKKTEKSASSLEQTLTKYATIGTVIYGVKQAIDLAYLGFKKFSTIADDMSMVNSRLSLVTKSTEEYTRAQTELLSISNGARVSVKATTDLYGQLSRSTSSLGISQKDLLQVTDTISKSITISGASATAADAALLQLSQGFASGALRGEELNSIMEQTPRLAQAIANGMGVSIGQLRTMGAEGQLTAQSVMTALLSQTQAINQEFSKVAINGASGYNVLNNTIDTTVAKIDGQYKITQTTGMLYIAFGQTIDTIFSQLSSGWGNSTDSALNFGTTVVGVIKGFLTGIGYTYDALETIGAIFSTIRYAGEAAFYGIEYVATKSAHIISSVFEGVLNFIIDQINSMMSGIEPVLDFFGIPSAQITKVNFTSYSKTASDLAFENLSSAALNLKNSVVDIFDTGKGQEWADTIGATLDLKFKTLLANSKEATLNSTNNSNSQSSVVSPNTDIFTNVKNLYEDYKNNTSNTNNNNSSNTNAYEEYQKQIQEALNSLNTTTSSLSNTTEALNTLNTTLGEDGTYTVVKDTTNSVDNLNNSLEDVNVSAYKAADIFFTFSDTLLNSFKSNADSLLSVVTSSSNVVEMSYSNALANMEAVKQELIANPMNKDIGQKYADAFSQLQNSTSSFLNKDNFATKTGYDFAVATVSTQLGQYQNTAMAGYNVLESMNDFLQSINIAFEDGILTDEEKATISGVADTVNAKNDILLGNGGAVVGAVNSQQYYNNTGLATDANISAQQYYNNADVVGAVNSQQYYNNTGLARTIDIDGVNTQVYNQGQGSIYYLNGVNSAAWANINSTNTVSSAVESLRGGKTTGISLSGIVGTLPSLAVSTGLDVSQLSNLSSIAASSSSTSSSTNYMTSGNTTALKNLQLRQVTNSISYYAYNQYGSPYNTTAGNAQKTIETTSYSYYGDGGYTGLGYGTADHTGFRPVGIVHEDEWVAPKWMLNDNPAVFAQLESIRKKGSFASGGYTTPTTSNYSIGTSSTKELEKNTKDIKELMVNHILLTRDMYKLFQRLTNNGENIQVEGIA